MSIFSRKVKKQSVRLLPGNCKRQSTKVEDVRKIEPVIFGMLKLCYRPAGMYDQGAVALSHCQVDHDNPKRFFVMNDGAVYINPIILEKSEPFTHKEGCMSYVFRAPKKIKRFKKIKVEYMNLKKKLITEDIEGYKACIFQHEIDHFNGKAIYN